MQQNKTQIQSTSKTSVKKNTNTSSSSTNENENDNMVVIIPTRLFWFKGKGIVLKAKDRFIQLWSEQEVPIVHARYKRKTNDGYTQHLYDISIAGNREIISTREMLNGMFIDYFPRLTNIGMKANQSKYIDVIRALAESDTTLKYNAVSQCGVHFDEETNQYVRIYPNGKIRHYTNVSPHIELYPTPNFLDEQSWNSRFIYVFPDMKEQQEASNYLDMITPHGEAKLMFIHGIGCLSTWLNYEMAQRFTLMLQGKAGSGKTALSRIAASTAYPHTKKYNGNVNFKATPYDIESTINNIRHAPFSIDDNNNSVNNKSCIEILEKIVRSCFNGDEIRGRRTSSGDKKPPTYVRTNPIFTTEIIPQGIEDSLMQRMLFVTLEQNYINISLDSDKPDITEINKHVTSLYYWSDEYDKYMFEWVAKEGYEKVTSELSQRQIEIIVQLQHKLKEAWNSIHSMKLDEAIRRYADMASYLILHAQIMDTVTNNQFNFELSIKPLLFDMAMKQFAYLGFKQVEQNTIPFVDAIIDIMEKIGRNEKIENTVYCIQDAKTGNCPIVFFNGEKIHHSQWGFKPRGTDSYMLVNKNAIPLMYIEDNMLYITSTTKEILLKYSSLSFLKTTVQLGEYVENLGYLKKRDKNQRDINPRIQGKRPRVLAIDLNIILAEMYKNVTNEEKISEETAEKQKDAVTEIIDNLESEID